MYKRALVSVSDKTGLEAFLRPLAKQGLELVSTSGTGEFLKSKGFKVKDIKELTGFPEAFSGRVKTLHPYIYMALLSRDWISGDREVLKKYQLIPFDLVVGNLYPFEEKAANLLEDKEIVEWIDIGGPSLLRAAAKNYFRITSLCHYEDYPLAQKGATLEQRKRLAAKVFKTLSRYDSMIAEKLYSSRLGASDFAEGRKPSSLPPSSSSETSDLREERKPQNPGFSRSASFFKKLRYGENPHQKADWYKTDRGGLHEAEALQGKSLSYNNLLDFSAAILTVRELSASCSAVAVKHNNPCGAAVADNIASAVEKSLKGDPLSVFGGLLALNRPMDEKTAECLDKLFLEGIIAPDFSSQGILTWSRKKLFLEGIIAPDFSSQALECLKKKKNLRVLRWPDMCSSPLPANIISEVLGGFLIQTRDQIRATDPGNWEIVGSKPSEEITRDLIFALKICAHLKSNAIAIVKEGRTLGLGMGQVNRVDAVKLALQRAKDFHPDKKKGLILAGDAFFPFDDFIEPAANGGVSWIIQPGGSIRDEKILKKARERGINMILTRERHFKH